MFWRNPSAAFFGVVLPLGLLAIFGAVFAGRDEDLDVIVPGIAGMSVMSATFTSLAYNLTTLRERGHPQAPARDAAADRRLPGRAGRQRGRQRACCRSRSCSSSATCCSASRGRATGSRWRSSSCAGVICFALLGVALSHAIPNPESAPAYVNAVFLPQILIAGVFYDAEDAPQVIHDIAQILPLTHLVDGLSGAIVDNQGLGDHWVALLVLAWWARDRRRPRISRLFLGSAQSELTICTRSAAT